MATFVRELRAGGPHRPEAAGKPVGKQVAASSGGVAAQPAAAAASGAAAGPPAASGAPLPPPGGRAASALTKPAAPKVHTDCAVTKTVCVVGTCCEVVGMRCTAWCCTMLKALRQSLDGCKSWPTARVSDSVVSLSAPSRKQAAKRDADGATQSLELEERFYARPADIFEVCGDMFLECCPCFEHRLLVECACSVAAAWLEACNSSPFPVQVCRL